MGCCCPCLRSNNGTVLLTTSNTSNLNENCILIEAPGEWSRISTQQEADVTDVHDRRRVPNYQAVIDDAHRKFLSSSFVKRTTTDSETEMMRTKLMNATVSSSIFTSPKRSKPSSSETTSEGVVEILSAPIAVFNHDVLADEMAEIVAKNTFNLRVDDSNPTVASFKPVCP
eukprot:gene10543-21982_t